MLFKKKKKPAQPVVGFENGVSFIMIMIKNRGIFKKRESIKGYRKDNILITVTKFFVTYSGRL